MSAVHDTSSLRAATGLWCYEHRDRAITRAVLGGASSTLLAQIYDVTPLRLGLIVRKTYARVRPDWQDAAGYPYAWSVPLSTVREQREAFPL
jgi:hypothetical protein